MYLSNQMFFYFSLLYSFLPFSRNENTGNTNKNYKNAANTTIKSKTIYIYNVQRLQCCWGYSLVLLQYLFNINIDMNYKIRNFKYLNLENTKFTNNDMFY